MFSDGHRAEKRERWRCEGGHQKDCKALSSDYHDDDDGDDDADEDDYADDDDEDDDDKDDNAFNKRKRYTISLAVSNPCEENIQRIEDVEAHEARKRKSPQISSPSSS